MYDRVSLAIKQYQEHSHGTYTREKMKIQEEQKGKEYLRKGIEKKKKKHYSMIETKNKYTLRAHAESREGQGCCLLVRSVMLRSMIHPADGPTRGQTDQTEHMTRIDN